VHEVGEGCEFWGVGEGGGHVHVDRRLSLSHTGTGTGFDLGAGVLSAGGWRPISIGATGPAPFTGLRAGLVTARVVGRTRGVPVHGVSSLDAVARRALDESAARGGEPDPVVLVATDARRREVYAALFRANGPDDVTRLTEIDVCPPTLVVERISEQVGGIGTVDLVAGSGAALYPELVEKTRSREALAPVSGDALTQVRIALARLGRGEELGTEPLYLRHADVQMPAARKRVH